MSEIKVNKVSPRTNCGTVTLGDSGDSFVIPAGVSITNSGTASGFGSTGEVSWNTTVKTSTFTVTAGEGFFCNTTGGAFTANLPAGTAGSSFAIADYAATFQTHNLTVSPNGSQKIGGVNADVILSTEGQSAYFVYIDDTQGWVNVIDSTSNIRANAFIVATGGNTVATCGDFKIHTFTGPGTFCVSAAGACAANNIVDYVVVAGGGGSGNPSDGGRSSGSGGAGGFRYFATTPLNPQSGNPGAPLNGYGSPSPSGTAITVTAQAYPITVGGGGAAGPEPSNAGSSGGVSTFSTVTSAGGGSHTTAGGSGGGRYHGCTSGNTAGNTPPVTPPQGQPGGYGINDNTPSGNGNYVGGAGGGAIAAGANASTSSPYGAAGGAGAGITGFGTTGESSGCKYYFSGGGGGGGQTIKGPTPGFRSAAVGGLGGGGCGQITANTAAGPGSTGQAGTANTGGGAGGGGCNTSSQSGTGAAGGSGIVIIRYKFQ